MLMQQLRKRLEELDAYGRTSVRGKKACIPIAPINVDSRGCLTMVSIERVTLMRYVDCCTNYKSTRQQKNRI